MKWVASTLVVVGLLLTFRWRKSAKTTRKVQWIEPEDGIQYDMWPDFVLQSREYSTFRG